MLKRTKLNKAFAPILLCLMLYVIWGNSAMNGSQSSQMSGGVLQLLERVFGSFRDAERASYLIRKAAHMTEFAALAFFLSWNGYLFLEPKVQTGSLVLLLGLGTACVDETIQIFSAGRGSSLKDVWIDMAGFTLSYLLFRLVFRRARRRDKIEENTSPDNR